METLGGRLAQVTENDKPARCGPSPRDKLEGVLAPECAAILVYTTFPNCAAAEASGRHLVQEGLAGCINILPGMISIYLWQGTLQRSEEVVLIAKTTPERAEACMAAVLERHPYETPAVLALPVTAGGAAYLDWIRAGTVAQG
ncbi:MAG: divalent-cation tolerance protein CutA [Hyphomicrobium sp.]